MIIFVSMPVNFYLDYISLSHGEVEIIEPQGLDAAQFKIVQESGELGRNVMYAGQGEDGSGSKFTLGIQSHKKALKRMLQYWHFFGYEAIVYFKIKFTDTLYTIGQVDFNTAETDGVTYFTFSIKQIGKVQRFMRGYDVPTDLLSWKTLDGITRDPIRRYKMLAPAKPVIQISEWKAPQAGMFIETESPYTDPLYLNVVSQQVKTGIDDSLSFIDTSQNASEGAFKFLNYVRAATTLRNVQIEFVPDALYKYKPTGGTANQKGQLRVFVFWGQSEAVGDYQSILMWESIEFNGTSPNQQIFPARLTATIPVVNQTDRIWIAVVSANRNASRNRVEFGNPTIKITATSIAYDSTVQMCRVRDVMIENAARTSDMTISAPRWDNIAGRPTGEFYEHFMTTPSMMRNLPDKPFTITTKEIVEGYLPFCYGGYQVNAPEETVSYLRYPDFYRNVEMGYYPQVITEGYKREVDPEADIKAINVGFNTFQSQKENERANTQDEVHGNAKWLLPNKQGLNTKEVKIDVVMSAFSLEDARRKALDISDTAATQDDSKKYVVECVELGVNDPRRIKQQTATLQHQGNGLTLTLTNQGEFSWLLLGIETGDSFTVNSSQNPGTYPAVISVSERQLVLQALGEPVNYASNNTTFTYRVGNTTTHIWRTNEELEDWENISDGDNYANLKNTVGRIVRNYYSEFLSTAILNTPFGNIINTEYNNNPTAMTYFSFDVGNVVEAAEFRPNNAILSGWLHRNVRLVMNFEEYNQLQQRVPVDRGFIRFTDPYGIDRKIFPTDIAFTLGKDGGDSFCDVTGKEKLERDLLRIFSDGNVVSVNEKIQESGWRYSINEYGQVTLYATNGKKVANTVYWNEVTINGVNPATIQELIVFLDGISG